MKKPFLKLAEARKLKKVSEELEEIRKEMRMAEPDIRLYKDGRPINSTEKEVEMPREFIRPRKIPRTHCLNCKEIKKNKRWKRTNYCGLICWDQFLHPSFYNSYWRSSEVKKSFHVTTNKKTK